ncbi:hypothetical protein [Actinomycetospora termitidis]|uniref:Uncharacterized protein n=1 Tax=Actinomycetospora termitidis TaxID=3053470 RepID=A0ABT7MHV5_9PSEU|nr:hypothetical protein [Actinomycetospora sp. Odt1-22]MDL5159779.1 hypothetical protein [Actinomycetospora sp. Odt1-22]
MPQLDPAPLFDLVTGFPPDDAIDVTIPMPLSLAIYMTMLESTGHASEVAALRKVYIDEARETARALQSGSDRLRITHIVEERVRRINGLRPHVHFFVGTTVRDADGAQRPVDVESLENRASEEVLPDHRDRLVAATTHGCGLTWGPTSWSSAEVLEPPWLVDRASEAREEPPCPGPWPRRQILVGRASS